jgi:hypothetical protein
MRLVQVGNVPDWLQAAGGAAAVYTAVQQHRQRQALDWGVTYERLAGLEHEDLRRIVEDNPAVAELVWTAWEAAADTASLDKRRLLAKVAAAAVRGDADADVDELQFLLRTVIALDPAHVTLLVLIGQLEVTYPKASDPVDRRAARAELEDNWRSPPDLMDPALAALEREGLAHSVMDYGGAQRGWKLHPYGRRFLDHLLVDEGGWPPPEA